MTRPSTCFEVFQCRKLRYAEGLKRHLVDSNDHAEQDEAGGTCQASSSKRRHVSPSNVCSRRFGTSIPPNTGVNNRLEPAKSVQEYSAFYEDTATRRKSRQSKTCSRCFKTFTTAVQLQMHATSHHVPYKCPLCSQTFSGLSLLKTHINSIHV